MLYFPGKIICATSVNDLDILLEIVQIWLYVTTVDFLGENSFNFCRSCHDLSEREEKMEYKFGFQHDYESWFAGCTD